MTKLIPLEPFTKENYEHSKNKKLIKGRVINYNINTGYGFICTQFGTEIYFNNKNLRRQHDMYRIAIGTKVSFKVIQKDDSAEQYYAIDILAYDPYPNGSILELPNNIHIAYKNIKFIYYNTGNDLIESLELEDKVPENYDLSTLNHICIITKNYDKYRFFDYSSSITGDGKCNLEELRNDLKFNIYGLR